MATNVFTVSAGMSGTDFPLRGDMGATLNFIPDNHFTVSFHTEDAGTFTILSNAAPFQQLDGSVAPSFTLGGLATLFVKFMYDPVRVRWIPVKHNLRGGSAGGGGGQPGAPGRAATITLGSYSQVAYNQPLVITETGTFTDAVLNFQIPGPAPGIPPGGTIGQYVVKTGSADFQAGWATLSGGTGGGTAQNTAEVPLTPVNGVVQLTRAMGFNFRLVLTQNVKLLNPQNYLPGDVIDIIVEQGAGAPWALSADTLFALRDGSPISLATIVGGSNEIRARLTDGPKWITQVTPEPNISVGYMTITPIATIGSAVYYYLGTPTFHPDWVSVATAYNAGDTTVIVRSGKGQEATGTFGHGNVRVYGRSIGGSGDQRPLLQLGHTEYGDGQPNRPSFGKALLNFEGTQTSEVRDLRIAGAMNLDGDARGICPNDFATLLINNVEITDCNNGILTGNEASTASIEINDCRIDRNGVGSPSTIHAGQNTSAGYVHNIYIGHNPNTATIRRTSLTNSITGHNLKTRSAIVRLEQVLCEGATQGREWNIPNGGDVYAKNCRFHKVGGSIQGQLCSIGEEGVDTSRARSYVFENCAFDNDNPSNGGDVTFWINFDHVSMHFINCSFSGGALSLQGDPNNDPAFAGMVTVNGIRYWPDSPPVFTNTGPLGPRLPVGYFPIAMTPA